MEAPQGNICQLADDALNQVSSILVKVWRPLIYKRQGLVEQESVFILIICSWVGRDGEDV